MHCNLKATLTESTSSNPKILEVVNIIKLYCHLTIYDNAMSRLLLLFGRYLKPNILFRRDILEFPLFLTLQGLVMMIRYVSKVEVAPMHLLSRYCF